MINQKTLILFFYLVIMFFGVGIASAQQQTLKGKVVNKEKQPVEFVHATLLKNDSIFVEGTATDSLGYFSFKAEKGNYRLILEQFGAEYFNEILDLNQDLDLGEIEIDESVVLEGITITARKKLIERKVDRLVFNVENSTAAAGGDVLDVLRITPRVKVENDQISMIGKKNMKVMVDGRIIQLTGNDLNSYLRTIRSDDIKSIEIITNPSSKYDAEGNSGIINIITKKAKSDTWNSSVNSTYKQATYATGSGSASFNLQKNKLSLNSSVGIVSGAISPSENTKIYYPGLDWTEANNRKDITKSFSINAGVDYDINDRLQMGVFYNYVGSRPEVLDRNTTTLYNTTALKVDSVFYTSGKSLTQREINRFNYHTIYKTKIPKLTMSFDYDFFAYKNESDRSFETSKILNNNFNPYISAINKGVQNINNHSLNFDVDHTSKWANFNYGTKVSFINTNNNFSYFDIINGVKIEDINQANNFEYKENTQALYFSANKEIGKNWELKLGARLENTKTEGYSATINKTNNSNYTKLFPTVYLSYKLLDNHNVSINYGRRIERPSYYFLNPFRWVRSPYMYSEGNPFLQPSFTDNIELGYSFKSNFITTIYYSSLKEGFEQLTIIDPTTNIQKISPYNFLRNKTIGLNQIFIFSPFNWWQSNNTGDVYFSNASSNSSATLPRLKGWNFEMVTSNDFDLAKNIRLNATLILLTSGVDNLDERSSLSQFNLAMKFSFLNDKLIVSTSANDIFGTTRPVFTSYSNNIKTVFRNYYDQQSFTVSLRYSFGSKFEAKQKKLKNENEFERTQ